MLTIRPLKLNVEFTITFFSAHNEATISIIHYSLFVKCTQTLNFVTAILVSHIWQAKEGQRIQANVGRCCWFLWLQKNAETLPKQQERMCLMLFISKLWLFSRFPHFKCGPKIKTQAADGKLIKFQGPNEERCLVYEYTTCNLKNH